MTINLNTLKAGTKFEVTRTCNGWGVGSIVTFERTDGDGDPVFRGPNDQNSDWLPRSRWETYVKRYNTEFDNKWIAWNVHGSVMAESEEEVKSKAEGILNQMPHHPVYVAQAQKMAKINAVVWTE